MLFAACFGSLLVVPVKADGQDIPWGVSRVRADLAWARNIRGQGIHVAIVDSGISDCVFHEPPGPGNPDLYVSDPSISFFDNVGWWRDTNGHGTGCAGVIAAMDNDIGVIGVAPDIWLHAVKVTHTGAQDANKIGQGIRWCANNSIHIISVSQGIYEGMPGGSTGNITYLDQSLDYAMDMGCLIVASAGDTSEVPGLQCPANLSDEYDTMLTVGAVYDDGSLWEYSPPGVDLVAPGVDILTTYDRDDPSWYIERNGTSFACPYVAGVAALYGSMLLAKGYKWWPGEAYPGSPGLAGNVTEMLERWATPQYNTTRDKKLDEELGCGLVEAWLPTQDPLGDIALSDSIVDIFDVVACSYVFGETYPGTSQNVSLRCADIDNNLVIDIYDLVAIALNFGKEGENYQKKLFGGLLDTNVAVSVVPSAVTAYKGDVLSVNITVSNVANLYGWEFKLLWNSTVLNCTEAEVHVPVLWWNSTFELGPGLENNFTETSGRFWRAIAAVNPAPAFNGSMTLATLTFKAVGTGATALDLQDVKLANQEASAIPTLESDGSVTVLPPTWFMRGDQHTINSLTAYKLWKPQTATARTYIETKPIYELSAEWRIQVWKRSQSGTETPISSGIVAQVTRTNPGGGLQSATWNCPETNLSPADAIVVRVYQRFEGFSWQLAGTFITPQLGATKLNATTWTVYYYTKLFWFTQSSKAYFYWGTTTYNSRIQNIEYT
jgi:hypothetical protein